MRKAILVFLLVASICFQGVALGKQVRAREGSGDAGHSLLHSASVAHHHHDDGSIHQDLSKKSKRHLQADCGVSVVAIPPSKPPTPALYATPADPADARGPGYQSPFLEGLKRPPRQDA